MKNLFWHKIGTLVVFNTDYILLSIYTSLQVVAVYSTYLLVYVMIITVVGILSPVLAPMIGKFIAHNNKKNIYDYWNKLHVLYVYIGTVVVIVTYYMLNPFISLWMGDIFLLPTLTVVLILINLYVQITRSMLEVFKTNSGFYDDVYNPVLESIINLVVSLILVQEIGLNGVIIGTICSNIITIYILKPAATFVRCFDKKVKDYIYVYSKYVLLTLVSIYASNSAVNYFGLIASIDSWIVWTWVTIKIFLIVVLTTGVIFSLDRVYREFMVNIWLKKQT